MIKRLNTSVLSSIGHGTEQQQQQVTLTEPQPTDSTITEDGPQNGQPAAGTIRSSEVPKSPPKWPLRPGVFVHVKGDTKQNLCAQRNKNLSIVNKTGAMTTTPYQFGTENYQEISSTSLNTNNQLKIVENQSTVHPVTSIGLSVNNLKSIDKMKQQLTIDMKQPGQDGSGDGIHIGDTSKTVLNQTDTNVLNSTVLSVGTSVANTTCNDEQLISFTSSNVIQRLLGRIRWRRLMGDIRTSVVGGIRNSTTKNNQNDNMNIKPHKKTTNIFRRTANGIFGSGKSISSSTGLVDARHDFSGITCTDGGKYTI